MNYFNSTIKLIRKKCSSCGNPNAIIFSKGRCSYCAKKECAKPIAKSVSVKEVDEELEKFFRNSALEIAKHPFCMECKEHIYKDYYRHATAHVLPKKLFKSVAAHPANYLILGASCGCHEKSHVWSNFKKMKVWPMAVSKFKILYPLLYPYELQFLPQQLLDELKND